MLIILLKTRDKDKNIEILAIGLTVNLCFKLRLSPHRTPPGENRPGLDDTSFKITRLDFTKNRAITAIIERKTSRRVNSNRF